MSKKCWRFFFVLSLITLIFSFLPLPARAHQELSTQQDQAQQSRQAPAEKPQPSSSSPQAPEKDPPPDVKPNPQTGTSNDRLFWTLPNFLSVENAKNIPPLSTKEKFKVTFRSSFDPVEYAYVGFLAGISQAENSEPGYGQGFTGYRKRYGATFADNTIENFMVAAVLPSLFRQDPRYYQLGKGGFWHRAGYSISRIFVTRTDSGHNQFNVSEIAGSAIAAGIAVPYHPVGDRTVSNTISVWWTQVGWDTVAIVVREFWPDIRRKAHKHRE